MKPPLKKRVPKPRNPFVALAMQRQAGTHDKPAGSRRQREKRDLKQRLSED